MALRFAAVGVVPARRDVPVIGGALQRPRPARADPLEPLPEAAPKAPKRSGSWGGCAAADETSWGNWLFCAGHMSAAMAQDKQERRRGFSSVDVDVDADDDLLAFQVDAKHQAHDRIVWAFNEV